MGKRSHAIRRSDSGFTLTELLIVIIILGVLTGIVVFAVGQFSNRGELSACKASRKTVEVAVESYRANNSGALPTGITVGANPLVPGYLRTDPNAGAPPYTVTLDLDGPDNVAGNADDGAVTAALNAGGVC